MKTGRALVIARVTALVCGMGIFCFGTPKPAAAQVVIHTENVISIAVSPTGTELDTYAKTTIVNYSSLNGDYSAYVESFLDQDGSSYASATGNDNGSGVAEADINKTVSLSHDYTLEGDYYLIDNISCFDAPFDPTCGGGLFLVETLTLSINTSPPQILSISPSFGYVGTSGTITVAGNNLVDPMTGIANVSFSSGTGLTITSQSVNDTFTALFLNYTISQNASTGPRNIILSDEFGSSTSSQSFTVGDPTPSITSVSPPVWLAGTPSLSVSIGGSGFGTNPGVTVSGTGVTLVTFTPISDSLISATVNVSSGAPTQTATVQVTSNGDFGSGFLPVPPGEPASSSYNVLVQGVTAPVPQIQLFGQTITTTQSVIVGQEIALSATVSNLPQGYAISSQSWSMPPGTPVGGYTNSTGSLNSLPDTSRGCVLLIQGQTSQPYSCSSTPVSTTDQFFTFYWVGSGSGGSAWNITYSYTATKIGFASLSNSATASFTVDAPSGLSIQLTQNAVSIIPPPNNYPVAFWRNNPLLEVGGGAPNTPGAKFQAALTHSPGTGGVFQWVQLVNINASQDLGFAASNDISGSPELDNTFPYGFKPDGTSLTTVTSSSGNLHDISTDSPTVPLLDLGGEHVRSFGATMYLMWIPQKLSGCSTSNTFPYAYPCVMPVPLGAATWAFQGDVINSLVVQRRGGIPYPLYVINYGTQPSPTTTWPTPTPPNKFSPVFQSGGNLPSWSMTILNQ